MLVPVSRHDRYYATSHVSSDACTHGQGLSGGWQHRYEQLERGSFLGEIEEAWLGPLQLLFEKISRPIKYEGRAWSGARIFFSCAAGQHGMHWDTRLVQDDQLTTFRWNAIERVTCSQPSESALVLVDDDYLSHLAEQARVDISRTSSEQTFERSSDRHIAHRFQTVVVDILRTVNADASVLKSETCRASMRDQVLDVLLCALAGMAQTGDARLPPPCTRAYIVNRAIEFIDSRLADSVSMADICSAVRVCPRTLCYSFEAVLGMSPRRYLLTTRLNRVRSDILALGGSVPLQTLATRRGLWHMGRFSRYYRETFGERPSDTVRRASAPVRKSLRTCAQMWALDLPVGVAQA
jgi:AraC family transcriptional regulator, ethanolamine operon transcriptional activator